jgi:hypothetical protein
MPRRMQTPTAPYRREQAKRATAVGDEFGDAERVANREQADYTRRHLPR